MEQSKILITGARGLLGAYLAKRLQEASYQVMATTTRPDSLTQFDFINLNEIEIAQFLEKNLVKTVIHYAALSNVDECERKPDYCHWYNVELTRKLLNAANAVGAQLVFSSTNAVYDGDHAPYSEAAKRNPVHKYGMSKCEAEDLIFREAKNYLVFRFILSFGWHAASARENPLTQIVNAYRSGKRTLKMVDDVYANTLYADDACHAVMAALQSGCKNDVFNVAGGTRQSRYEFANSVKEIFSLQDLVIERASSADFPSLVRRPLDTSFDCGKLRNILGIVPRAVDVTLQHCKVHKLNF